MKSLAEFTVLLFYYLQQALTQYTVLCLVLFINTKAIQQG